MKTESVMQLLTKKYPDQLEYLQAVQEVCAQLSMCIISTQNLSVLN